MLIPKRWYSLAFFVGVGSAIGALALAILVELHGLPWILQLYPQIDQSQIWILAQKFFQQYGLLLVLMISLSPFPQQPVIILASLAQTHYFKLVAVVLFGRLLKSLVFAYLASHAPGLLSKMWGLKSESPDRDSYQPEISSSSTASSRLP